MIIATLMGVKMVLICISLMLSIFSCAYWLFVYPPWEKCLFKTFAFFFFLTLWLFFCCWVLSPWFLKVRRKYHYKVSKLTSTLVCIYKVVCNLTVVILQGWWIRKHLFSYCFSLNISSLWFGTLSGVVNRT